MNDLQLDQEMIESQASFAAATSKFNRLLDAALRQLDALALFKPPQGDESE